MKISLYTLLTDKYSLAESLELAAAAGFDAVDLRQGRGGADAVHLSREITDAEAEQVRRAVEATGLAISGLTTYCELGKPEGEDRAELEGLRRGFRVAQILGTPYVRCAGPWLRPEARYETVRADFRRQVEIAATAAEEAKIVLNVEQHGGGWFSSAGQIRDMLRGLECSHLGVVFDPGNALVEGYERPRVQVDMLRDLIRAVHVKNGMPQPTEGASETVSSPHTRLDQGLLDWPAIAAQLREIGYEGYLTLEDFYEGFGSIQEKLSWDADYLQRLAG